MTKIDKLPLKKVRREYIRHQGQRSGIRFFDPEDREDMVRLRKIVKSKKVIEWMDDTRLSDTDIIDWAEERSGNSYLFAVIGIPPTVTNKEEGKVQGFVYFYTGRKEKGIIKRLVKAGVLHEKFLQYKMFELSNAKLPKAPNGQMASATRQACLEVKKMVKKEYGESSPAQFFGFIDPDNTNAIRAAEAAGFSRVGKMKYEIDSPVEQSVYLMDWKKLKRKMTKHTETRTS